MIEARTPKIVGEWEWPVNPAELVPIEDDEEFVPNDPHVSISVDETSISADGMERDYIVSITVLGQKEQQEIKVIKRDATGSPIIELNETMQPGQAKELRITGRGNTTIQVYHDGELIKQEHFTVEAPVSNNNE